MRPVALLSLLLSMASAAHAGAAIEFRVDGGRWQVGSSTTILKGQKIELRTRVVPGAAVRWYQIFPDVSAMYKNANFPWDQDAYKWIGFGKIRYFREEIRGFRDQWRVRPFRPTQRSQGFRNESARSRYFHYEVGSFWFQVEVENDGKVDSSPGIKDSDHRGLSPKVFRVSVRDGDGFLGYLTTFFNVPAVFGSVPFQSNNYIGADCADTLIAARGKWRGETPTRNYNVAMLVKELPTVAEFDLSGGRPNKQIRWGKDVRPGDFIAVRYQGARSYQHIGALFGDRNDDGRLDAEDTMLHAGPYPLALDRLSSGAFDGHVSILRP